MVRKHVIFTKTPRPGSCSTAIAAIKSPSLIAFYVPVLLNLVVPEASISKLDYFTIQVSRKTNWVKGYFSMVFQPAWLKMATGHLRRLG